MSYFDNLDGYYHDVDSFPDIDDPQEIIMYYKLERAATKYAFKFWDILTQGSPLPIRGDILPIFFQDRLAVVYDMEYGKGRNTFANFAYSRYAPQAVIRIALPRRTKNSYLHKALKKSIRHELIHYYLWLHELPCEDDSALFWAFCNIYDGGAYKELSAEESSKFERFEQARLKTSITQHSKLQYLARGIVLDSVEDMKEFNQFQ